MDIIYLFQYFFGWLVVGSLHFIYDLNSIRDYVHIYILNVLFGLFGNKFGRVWYMRRCYNIRAWFL